MLRLVNLFSKDCMTKCFGFVHSHHAYGEGGGQRPGEEQSISGVVLLVVGAREELKSKVSVGLCC